MLKAAVCSGRTVRRWSPCPWVNIPKPFWSRSSAATVRPFCNGQEYTLLLYECGSDTNPYSRGVSAFTTYENYAISAELTCREAFTGDVLSILTDFLEGCHYNAALR